MARWSPSEFPIPKQGDTVKVEEFIRKKYIDQKWVDRGGQVGREWAIQ